MTANPLLLQKKYSRIVKLFSDKTNTSLDDALKYFYESELYKLISQGISDMHCMSDEYLVEDLIEEYNI